MERELVLAGGCFWGTQALLDALHGTLATQAGYANGTREHPSYEQVCAGDTRHAEAVRVRYDDALLSLDALLDWYFASIDPAAPPPEGRAHSWQYRNGVYYSQAQDEAPIAAALKRLGDALGKPPAIELSPLTCFYPAEEGHQHYLQRNPGGYCHIPRALLARARSRPIEIPDRYHAPVPEALRKADMEPPYSHPEWNRFDPGIYVDAATGEPLFASRDKTSSLCGWLTFERPLLPELLSEHAEKSHGAERIEVRSRGGNTYLGHVCIGETGERLYCINGRALQFIPRGELQSEGLAMLLSVAD